MLGSLKLLLAKEESVYGTDPTPTPGSNAIECFDCKVNYRGDVLERNLHSNSLSPNPPKIGKRWIDVNFSVELKGSGTAGSAPIIGDLLEACGFVETVSAGSSVTYVPASSTMKSVTLYVHDMIDSTVCRRHKVTGARGEVNFVFESGQVARAEFSLSGLYNIPTDTTVSFTSYPETTLPPIVESLTFTLNSITSLVCQAVNFAMGNRVVAKDDFNSAGSIKAFTINGRKPTGKMNPESVTVATYDYWTDWLAATQRSMSLILGSTAGNKVTITAPKITIDEIPEGDREGIRTDEIPFRLSKSTANDEISVKFS